jgi:hypothetical protein
VKTPVIFAHSLAEAMAKLTLQHGVGHGSDGTACIMSAIGWMRGCNKENIRWNDHPVGVHAALRDTLIMINDSSPTEILRGVLWEFAECAAVSEMWVEERDTQERARWMRDYALGLRERWCSASVGDRGGILKTWAKKLQRRMGNLDRFRTMAPKESIPKKRHPKALVPKEVSLAPFGEVPQDQQDQQKAVLKNRA